MMAVRQHIPAAIIRPAWALLVIIKSTVVADKAGLLVKPFVTQAMAVDVGKWKFICILTLTSKEVNVASLKE